MSVSVLGSASLSASDHAAAAEDVRGDARNGGDAEPNTDTIRPVSPELGLAIARAHVAWARLYAPHLLEEWTAA